MEGWSAREWEDELERQRDALVTRDGAMRDEEEAAERERLLGMPSVPRPKQPKHTLPTLPTSPFRRRTAKPRPRTRPTLADEQRAQRDRTLGAEFGRIASTLSRAHGQKGTTDDVERAKEAVRKQREAKFHARSRHMLRMQRELLQRQMLAREHRLQAEEELEEKLKAETEEEEYLRLHHRETLHSRNRRRELWSPFWDELRRLPVTAEAAVPSTQGRRHRQRRLSTQLLSPLLPTPPDAHQHAHHLPLAGLRQSEIAKDLGVLDGGSRTGTPRSPRRSPRHHNRHRPLGTPRADSPDEEDKVEEDVAVLAELKEKDFMWSVFQLAALTGPHHRTPEVARVGVSTQVKTISPDTHLPPPTSAPTTRYLKRKSTRRALHATTPSKTSPAPKPPLPHSFDTSPAHTTRPQHPKHPRHRRSSLTTSGHLPQAAVRASTPSSRLNTSQSARRDAALAGKDSTTPKHHLQHQQSFRLSLFAEGSTSAASSLTQWGEDGEGDGEKSMTGSAFDAMYLGLVGSDHGFRGGGGSGIFIEGEGSEYVVGKREPKHHISPKVLTQSRAKKSHHVRSRRRRPRAESAPSPKESFPTTSAVPTRKRPPARPVVTKSIPDIKTSRIPSTASHHSKHHDGMGSLESLSSEAVSESAATSGYVTGLTSPLQSPERVRLAETGGGGVG